MILVNLTMKGYMNTFRYDKEGIYKEFNLAKEKDIKLGKGDDNKVHTNRINFLKDMIKLEKEMPEVLSNVDINFNRLLIAYQSQNPRDHFYRSVFNKSYEEMQEDSQPKSVSDYS